MNGPIRFDKACNKYMNRNVSITIMLQIGSAVGVIWIEYQKNWIEDDSCLEWTMGRMLVSKFKFPEVEG